MEGYFQKNISESNNSGRLNIEVRNLPEFEELINRAEKEINQLKCTIDKLKSFDIEVEFTTNRTTSSR